MSMWFPCLSAVINKNIINIILLYSLRSLSRNIIIILLLENNYNLLINTQDNKREMSTTSSLWWIYSNRDLTTLHPDIFIYQCPYTFQPQVLELIYMTSYCPQMRDSSVWEANKKITSHTISHLVSAAQEKWFLEAAHKSWICVLQRAVLLLLNRQRRLHEKSDRRPQARQALKTPGPASCWEFSWVMGLGWKLHHRVYVRLRSKGKQVMPDVMPGA